MRKIMLLIIVLTLLSSCKKEVTLEQVTDLMIEQGAVLQEKKPIYPLIGAIDGVMLYYDKKPCKIYKFNDKEKMKKTLKDYPMFLSKGMIVLEAYNDKLIDSFKNLE